MRRPLAHPAAATVLVGLLATLSGCCRALDCDFGGQCKNLEFYKDVATQIEYPDVDTCHLNEVDETQQPRTLKNPDDQEIWGLSLEEAIRVALENSKVMRDLGGRLLTSPTIANTTYEPALQESDPRFGVEGVLSAFDAQASTSIFWEKNDRAQNFNAGSATVFAPVFQQDLGTFQSGISKRNATGGLWGLSYQAQYDANNSPTNLFPSAWTTNLDATFTQPLLQGAGVRFNRIAGPNAVPGFYNGVVIARINNDIALTDFETGVRNLVSDVENAYWDLYFAYRDLDAKMRGRDEALTTWRKTYAQGKEGVSAADESLAREQYFFFRSQVENALSGVSGQSTVSGGGNGGGNFRAAGGVYARETNLRFLMGLSANDGRLIRPTDEPILGKVEFDWEEILNEGLCRRVELRRQKWVIKRREMELLAARNFLFPRLDATGRYRWRGFGDDLTGSGTTPFDSATQNMLDGNFQEWQAGLTFSMPIGMRQAMAGVRNAQLHLARERAVLEDQELQVSHDLSGAIREVDRAWQLVQTNFNRRVAAQRQVNALQQARDVQPDKIGLNVLLDSHRRLADAEVNYYRSVVEYNLAVKGVHFEKGSLLDYNSVELAEGPWPCKAYRDAERRADHRRPARPLDYSFLRPNPVSRGTVHQGGPTSGVMAEGEVYEGETYEEGEVMEGGQPTPADMPQPPSNIEDLPPRPAPPRLPGPAGDRDARGKGQKQASTQPADTNAATQTAAARPVPTIHPANIIPLKPIAQAEEPAAKTTAATASTATAQTAAPERVQRSSQIDLIEYRRDGKEPAQGNSPATPARAAGSAAGWKKAQR